MHVLITSKHFDTHTKPVRHFLSCTCTDSDMRITYVGCVKLTRKVLRLCPGIDCHTLREVLQMHRVPYIHKDKGRGTDKSNDTVRMQTASSFKSTDFLSYSLPPSAVLILSPFTLEMSIWNKLIGRTNLVDLSKLATFIHLAEMTSGQNII